MLACAGIARRYCAARIARRHASGGANKYRLAESPGKQGDSEDSSVAVEIVRFAHTRFARDAYARAQRVREVCRAVSREAFARAIIRCAGARNALIPQAFACSMKKQS